MAVEGSQSDTRLIQVTAGLVLHVLVRGISRNGDRVNSSNRISSVTRVRHLKLLDSMKRWFCKNIVHYLQILRRARMLSI